MPTLSNAALATQAAVPVTVTPTPYAPIYAVKVVNRAAPHTVIATLTRANVEDVEWELNGVGSAQFSLHTLDPDALHLSRDLMVQREVQIWRDDRCIWWGVPLTSRADLQKVTFSCVGLLWYYTRRYFGPIQNNYLSPNADFESGLTNWTAVGTTASASTEWRAIGTQSAKLVQATAETDTYLRRRYTADNTGGTQAVFHAVKAFCHIKGTGWVGPAFEERGLYVELQATAGGAAVGEPQWDPITESTPRDSPTPVRLETGITVPAGVSRVIEVRLYSPGGTIYWDHTALAVEESVGSAITGDEAVHIINRVNTYAQSAAQGKSDLSIGFGNAPGTFATLVRIYQFFDNGQILDAFSEYPKIGVLDFEVIWDPYNPTSRRLFVWPGTKGVHKAGSPLTLGTNIVQSISYDVDGSAITTSARVIGQGEGADREIGWAMDTSQLGGLVLESVDSAPSDAPVDTLDRLAAEQLDEAKRPVCVPEFRLRAADVIGVVDLGDTVPVTANYGYIQEASTTRRIIRMRLDAQSDSVTLGWN